MLPDVVRARRPDGRPSAPPPGPNASSTTTAIAAVSPGPPAGRTLDLKFTSTCSLSWRDHIDPRRDTHACRRHYRSVPGARPRPGHRARRRRLVRGGRRPRRGPAPGRRRRAAGRSPRRRTRGRTDSWHRGALAAAAAELGGADLLVNNASTLGASPLPRLADLEPTTYAAILEVNVVAPIALAALLLPQLRERRGRILNITSDASVEAYPTWGGYGSSKAALDHATRVLAEEEPELRVYAVDPGDLRTEMHQRAFPGEDISDRPEPGAVVPHLLALVTGDLPSGRHRAADLSPAAEVPALTHAHPRGIGPAGGPRTRPRRRAAGRRDSVRDRPRDGARPARPPRARRPARGQHQRDAAVGRRPGAARLHLGDPRVDRARRRQLGGRAPPTRQPRAGRARPGEVLRLPGGVRLRVLEPHPVGQTRLWRARPLPAVDRVGYLREHGRPIRYPYVDGDWPLGALQNAYATHPGSAEMPSAGRPLTERCWSG